LAEIELGLRETADARGNITWLVEHSTDQAANLVWQARLARIERRFDDVLQLTEPVFELAQQSPVSELSAWLTMASAFGELGEVERSETTLRLANSERPDLQVQAALAYVLAKYGHDLDEAEKLLESVLALQPSNPYFHWTRGVLRCRQDRVDDGLADFKQVATNEVVAESLSFLDDQGDA
jgi:tetratricopeptide (TPR) repeat protein